MRTDIYVVQKNEQEGKQLEEWCKEQGLPIEGLCLSFVEGNYNRQDDWICFYYNKNEQAFRKNEELKKCINLKQVTIEEFKRLQLESLGKTEIPLKIGDWVLIKPSEFSTLGEGTKFNDKKDVPLCIEEIDTNIVRKLSGINCALSFDRFEKCEKPVEEKFITGKWYKILDNWWAKFKTVHNSGNRWQFSEHIDKNGAYSNIIQSIDVISEIKLLTDLSEIQEYLPLNHSDLIVKNICPEYVEYIDTKYKGQIVRVTEWSSANYCKIHHPIDGILKPFKDLIKPSTQEAFNKQSDSNKGFIVGEWYKSNVASSKDYYIKVKNVRDENHIEGDCIRTLDTKPYQENSYWDVKESIQDALQRGPLTDLSEIQEYLPDGHIDRQIQTNDKWLIEQAKRLYPIGTKIYQLYAGGTLNKSHEISIQNHNFMIDSDGEVLYNAQYRLYTPINDTWATKVEEQPKYEVVHCKTQEEWDFVIKTEKITKLNSKTFKQNEKECIVLKALKYQSDIHTASSHKWLSENNAKIYTFEEWCNNNGYNFESIKKSVEGHFYIKLKNQKELNEIIKYFENKGYINSNQKTVFGDKYFIVYPEYRKFQLLALDCGYPEKQWVFESSNKLVPKIGEYYFKSDFIFIHVDPINYKCNNTALDIYNKLFHFKNAAMDIWNKNPERLATQEEKEWLNKCIKAGRFVEKDEKPINFGGLNLENWLRETKKLNLSLEELDKHISLSATCHFDNVYSWLNGIGSLEKAEILWNEWNNSPLKFTSDVILPEQDSIEYKHVIGIDLYKLPETQLLIKHKNSQINTEVKNESSVKTNLKQKSKKVLF